MERPGRRHLRQSHPPGRLQRLGLHPAHARRRGRRCHPDRTGVAPEPDEQLGTSTGSAGSPAASAEASFPRSAAPTSSPGADTAVTGSASAPTTRTAHQGAHQGPHVRQRAQRHGRRRPPCVERGWRRRQPGTRHRRVEPAVGLPVHRDGYHTIACVRSGKVLDKAVLDGGRRGGRTDDRRRPDEPAVAVAPAGWGRLRPGQPHQGVNDQAIALSSSKGARCLPSSADGACCK